MTATIEKKVLTEQAKKRGVRIVNHSPVLELLRDDNGITGALASIFPPTSRPIAS